MATIEEIKKKFRLLAKKYHPDHGGDPEKMIEILDIYDKLFKK
ncbi:DnaJ domain-containing protein [Alkaliphilus serpentinus]|uniref:DnaJ domain-containing protein n=1 Tax=Alkaliphilus serpentinus TaxID=1482731 RepID=A0A833MAN7_9FIRM|nr:DnaJ domain-containing protein [Alkaliphilus serpentinus]